MSEPVISLITDFGDVDTFVGTMKGVILNINPSARIVDLCHRIPATGCASDCILEAAFLISGSYRYFPEGTIQVVVVDPGVGSERRPILVQTPRFFFIAPDNGVLSYVYREQAPFRVFHLTQKQYFLSEISHTFHGRDIFAPVAAWLSTGILPQLFGPDIHDYRQLEIPQPRGLAPHVFEFQIIHIDNFGNLITTIRQDFFYQALSEAPTQHFSLEIASQIITCLHTHYASLDPASQFGTLFGSTGNLEIFANQNRGDQLLHVQAGDTGKITFS